LGTGWEQGVDLSNRTHADAADAQLLWLQKTLDAAEGKVMLLGHIPPSSAYGMYEEGFTGGLSGYVEPGVQLWWQSHIERYNTIVSSSNRVTFEIWGHLHIDTFFVPRGPPGRWKAPTGGARREPTSVLWVGPSLAAWYPPKNGGVRRYSFSNSSKEHVDSTVWYYDVEQSTKTDKLEFQKSWTASTDLFTQRPKQPIAPSDMLDLALSWRTNRTAHTEARARGYLHVQDALYPNCAGTSPMDERCRMIDVCTMANPAPTELMLCLMNWACANDDIARETQCMAPVERTVPAKTDDTPLVLTPSYFGATAATVRANSSWGHETTHAPHPENQRSLTFWGRFVSEPCASKVWGYTESHPLPGEPFEADAGFVPACGDAFGPSYEADVIDDSGHRSHQIRTQVGVDGPFTNYDSAGQNPSGANKYIGATYVSFNPSWEPAVANRMRPWGGAANDGDGDSSGGELRVEITTNQSVAEATIPQPDVQQLQQVVTCTFIQERCNRTTSSSFCQISFNIKTFIAGVHAYTASSAATAFNDEGSGGLIAVVGPINVDGQPTPFHNSSGTSGKTAWTSRGLPTADAAVASRRLVVEITWTQFQGVLRGVTGGDPAPVFGVGCKLILFSSVLTFWEATTNQKSINAGAAPENWVLLRAGYGQENYNNGNNGNNGSSTSTITGGFTSLEVASMGTLRRLKTDDPDPGEGLAQRPVYPLYAMVTGSVDFTKRDINTIAGNFDTCHCTTTAQQVAAFKAVHKPFRSVQYSNPSGTRDAKSGDLMQTFERHHRQDGGWYVAGRLNASISAEATELVAVPDTKKIGTQPRQPTMVMLVPSTEGSGDFSGPDAAGYQWVTYARLGDELLKITSVDNSSLGLGRGHVRVTVERGFGGTRAAVHDIADLLLAPLYNQLPDLGPEAERPKPLSYGLMAHTTLASDFLVNATRSALASGYDGSWFDCFGSSIFTVETATGIKLGVQDYYDPEHGRYWNVSSYLQSQRERLDRAYTQVTKGLPSRSPAVTILANGFWDGFGAFPASDGFLMMKSDRASAQPGFRLDGYCGENFYMSEHGPCGFDSIRSYKTEQQWIKSVQAVADAAQINAAVFPTIAGAGCGSQAMEANPNRTRDEGAVYASFLLAVERTAADGGRPSLGIQPLYFADQANRSSTRFAALHPRFHWEIGAPVETKPVVQYKLQGRSSYARRFATGLVLMNPSWNATDEIDLAAMYPGTRFVDRGNAVATGKPVPKAATAAQVTLAPQTAMVLVAAKTSLRLNPSLRLAGKS
jgi:hypothetical protein